MAITATVLGLDINYARHAGPLWRDEANSFAMATYPSLSTTWERLQFDSFPMLWYIALRAWVGLRFGQTDFGFRILGLIVNAGILGILWLNAWRMSRRPPLIGVTLLGANAAVMIYCGSIRGYGLGLLLGLWMYGTVWMYLTWPTRARWIVALIAALLACHTLYYNCVFVGAACLAAAVVAVSHQRWREAWMLTVIGAIAAASLSVYIPTFRHSGEWRNMYEFAGGFAWLWFKFTQAAVLSHSVMQSIWVAVVVGTPLGALLTWIRTRKHESYTIHEVNTRQSDLALFAAISLTVGVIGNILFLRALNYYMQPWYFLPLMAVVAAGADTAGRAASIGRGFRVFAVSAAAVVLMLILFSPLYARSFTRLTNLDEVARAVEQHAAKEDYVVLVDWTLGVTFNRYYHGSAAWQTLPPLPADAHDVHRSDLVFNQMQRLEVLGPVLDTVVETLRNGHRVFYIGELPKHFPSEQPNAYLLRRIAQRMPTSPDELWRYQFDYTLGQLATHITVIPINLDQPVSLLEAPELSVFEGWQPGATESTRN